MVPGSKKTNEELLEDAVRIVSDKLGRVNHSMHIVALSQELRALIQLRNEPGYGK